MKKTIEQMTQEYWNISSALRLPRDVAPTHCRNAQGEKVPITIEYAMRTLGHNTDYLSESRMLGKATHELKYDIIEGNTKWREGQSK